MMDTKQDVELIEFVMNCQLDFDFRKCAAMEIMRRTGVVSNGKGTEEVTAS